MTRTFDDDEARRRDALYQALRPSETFDEAKAHDKWASDLDAVGADIGADKQRALRDAELLPLAIRALTARQEVKPANH